VTANPITGAAFPTTFNGFGGSNVVPFLPRGYLESDPITRVDARLSKEFAVTERFRFLLLFEAFNITNSQYDTLIDTLGYRVGTDRVFRPNPAVGTGVASAGFPDGTNARRAQAGLRFSF
jgi:hypothetical protein